MPLKETGVTAPRRSFRELVPQEDRTKRLREVEAIYRRRLAAQTASGRAKRKPEIPSPVAKAVVPTAETALSPQVLEALIKKGESGPFIRAALRLDKHERKLVINHAVNEVSVAIVTARQEKNLPPERQSRALGKLFRGLLGVDHSDGRDVRSAMEQLEETHPDAYMQVVASLSVNTLSLIDGVGEDVRNVRQLVSAANSAVNALTRDGQRRMQMAAAGFEPEVKPAGSLVKEPKPKSLSMRISAEDIADSRRRDRSLKLGDLAAEIVSRDLGGGVLTEEDCDCDLAARFARRALDSPAKENALLRLARKGHEDVQLLLALTSWRLDMQANMEPADED